jgi:hypothetical protein
MTKIAATIAITLALCIGAMSGYWFRGRVLLAQHQASPWAFTTGPPPRVLTLAPPGYGGTPPPGLDGGAPAKLK